MLDKLNPEAEPAAITRFEIIDYTAKIPRTVVVNPSDNKEVFVLIQDEGRTLKVMIRNK